MVQIVTKKRTKNHNLPWIIEQEIETKLDIYLYKTKM
jgi:hypothetical protein